MREHHRGKQTPYIIAEPVNKSHLILVPQYASLADIATLRNDAYGAEVEGNLSLAEQLWIRVLVAASGQDIQAVRALQRIALSRQNLPNLVTQDVKEGGKGEQEKGSFLLQTFQFETVTVDAKGTITNRRNLEAKYFVEDLGNGVTLEMVQIPGGTFMMGSPATEAKRYDSESPQHQVTVPAFFMGRYPVTQVQYQAIVGSNPSNFKRANCPVEQVNWNEAVEFCKRLSQKTGRNYRLPSEAEWEYACRAITSTPFYFGETITTDLVNYDGTVTPYASAPKGVYRKETAEVGKFPPNAFGLYDMHGNVWEWCQDYSHDNYQGAPTDGSAWLTGGNSTTRLLRGGSWILNPEFCLCAIRFWNTPGNRNDNIGFRLVVVLA